MKRLNHAAFPASFVSILTSTRMIDPLIATTLIALGMGAATSRPAPWCSGPALAAVIAQQTVVTSAPLAPTLGPCGTAPFLSRHRPGSFRRVVVAGTAVAQFQWPASGPSLKQGRRRDRAFRARRHIFGTVSGVTAGDDLPAAGGSGACGAKPQLTRVSGRSGVYVRNHRSASWHLPVTESVALPPLRRESLWPNLNARRPPFHRLHSSAPPVRNAKPR